MKLQLLALLIIVTAISATPTHAAARTRAAEPAERAFDVSRMYGTFRVDPSSSSEFCDLLVTRDGPVPYDNDKLRIRVKGNSQQLEILGSIPKNSGYEALSFIDAEFTRINAGGAKVLQGNTLSQKCSGKYGLTLSSECRLTLNPDGSLTYSARIQDELGQNRQRINCRLKRER